MHVRAFIEEMERLAPPDLAEDFDTGKIGLVVEGKEDIVRVCCALDATPFVVQQAVMASADMLVVHHTPLWTPVTALTGRTAGLMRALLSAQMNLYVMHTNFDRAPEGVNDALAESALAHGHRTHGIRMYRHLHPVSCRDLPAARRKSPSVGRNKEVQPARDCRRQWF